MPTQLTGTPTASVAVELQFCRESLVLLSTTLCNRTLPLHQDEERRRSSRSHVWLNKANSTSSSLGCKL